jgi:hypothetical protein
LNGALEWIDKQADRIYQQHANVTLFARDTNPDVGGINFFDGLA